MIEMEHALKIERPAGSLARLYVEITNQCNLDCLTCMRNVWEEPYGLMSQADYQRILDGLSDFSPTPEVFFGGYGEPLYHPQVVEWVHLARARGARVELITNGTLLDERTARGLVQAGLNCLWVSIDGTSPEAYADVRLGAALPQVTENVRRFASLRNPAAGELPEIGIAMVLMQRNLTDLPEMVRLGRSLGATRFSISNVLAHTAQLRQESLYDQALYQGAAQPSARVDLPRIDLDDTFLSALAELLRSNLSVQINGQSMVQAVNLCPFVEKGSFSIRWDGQTSPCLPLLHTHHAYLGDRQRTIHAYSCGSIRQSSLLALWQAPAYTALRQRLQVFDFSPCVFCNTCDLSEQNLEDCFGSEAPACGGCLWAQGLIRCP